MDGCQLVMTSTPDRSRWLRLYGARFVYEGGGVGQFFGKQSPGSLWCGVACGQFPASLRRLAFPAVLAICCRGPAGGQE
jgi:hypothetical protein